MAAVVLVVLAAALPCYLGFYHLHYDHQPSVSSCCLSVQGVCDFILAAISTSPVRTFPRPSGTDPRNGPNSPFPHPSEEGFFREEACEEDFAHAMLEIDVLYMTAVGRGQ